ncbi:integrase core domain-containing protein [Corynebacterium propinquum]|uniref:integrase core domain-containing protein n=1 Tax=Corynebacterium propinquum TaxID=43769 RepID=UPI00254CC461|nr:integrase core domain-containing protein [Corynebacterium propinquum]MDK8536860.1 integrase core domain-containing protein [Corynebacterium propinquum]
MGIIRFHADRSFTAASSQPGDPSALKKQQVWRTIEDHGRQYVSVVYNERGAQHRITAYTGSVGDSYDNALAENVNGSYKNELIHTRSWGDVVEVEIATFEWVSWWNETRLHQSLGYRTPTEIEPEFWSHQPAREIIENKANA